VPITGLLSVQNSTLNDDNYLTRIKSVSGKSLPLPETVLVKGTQQSVGKIAYAGTAAKTVLQFDGGSTEVAPLAITFSNINGVGPRPQSGALKSRAC